MIRAILFDWFGVCTKENWVDCLARELHRALRVDEEKIRTEFKVLLQPFARAEISDDVFLQKFLHVLDPGKNPTDFQYLFTTIPEVNDAVLTFIAKLKRSYKTYLLSNNFGPVFPNYERRVDFHAYFDQLFLSHVLGLSKTQDGIWNIVLEQVGVQPDEVLFIDNKEKYLAYPRSIGVHTILYESSEQLEADVMERLASQSAS